MNNALYIYRSMDFDGNIHTKIVGETKFASARYALRKDGRPYAHSSMHGDTGVFRDIPAGTYQSTAEVTLTDGSRVTLTSPQIHITQNGVQKTDTSDEPMAPLPDTEVRLYDNVDAYFLDVLVSEDQAGRLRNDLHAILMSRCRIDAFSMESDTTAQAGVPAHITPNLCRIKADIPKEKLADVAAHINNLDYVAYCLVTPDTTNMAPPPPPERPPFQIEDHAEALAQGTTTSDAMSDITPDFSRRQGYLDPGLGMNVRAAWAKGVTGRGATVRHLDFGIYRNHEDLQGDVTVVNSRPESSDCNHGTASTGCIVATQNNSGVTGVAHGCRFFFYDIDDLNRLASDVGPGDIVGLDVHFATDGTYLPALDVYAWWARIKAMTAKGAIVVAAAGNGGNAIGWGNHRMHDHGDSGCILAGGCNAQNGARWYHSNYGHRANVINSWANAVATTGYHDMQLRPGNNRNYTAQYGGTSSATPLCVGALALIQSYAIQRHGVFLNAQEMTDLIARTGYDTGAAQGIGYRPNVAKAIEHLANQLR